MSRLSLTNTSDSDKVEIKTTCSHQSSSKHLFLPTTVTNEDLLPAVLPQCLAGDCTEER